MDDLPSIVPGLAALAGRELVEGNREPFVLTIDDVPIRVEYTTGTTPTVWLTTPYAPRAAAEGYRETVAPIRAPRPMFIELTSESADDRDAKARGVSREVQTGHAEFDRAVYVNTVSADTVVQRVLASPKLRRAVQLLLADGARRR